MGCGSSRVQPAERFEIREDVRGQDAEAAAAFEAMRLDRWTLDSLYTTFCTMDVSDTGRADLDCWYRYFRFNQSSFHDRCFGLFDMNGDGFITFDEFVRSTVDLCSMDHKSLLRFAFMMFDADGNGVMAKEELVEMVREMYGPKWDSNARVAAVVHSSGRADANGDGVLSFEEFCDLDKMFPSLLMPAFSMQNRVRELVLGLAYWEKAYKERAAAGPGYNAFDILSAVQASRREALRMQDAGQMGGGGGTGERYMPEYLRGQQYVPTVSVNPRAKAERRRSQVDAAAALKAGDKEKAAALLAEVKRQEALEAEAAAELQASKEKDGVPDDEDEEEEGGRGRRGSAAGGRRASAVRRSSAIAASAARRHSALGIASGTQLTDGSERTAKSRRRSSVANAAERAAAMAMNA